MATPHDGEGGDESFWGPPRRSVHTLVFAYPSASLPVLLIFSVGDTSFADAVNGEAVATR